MSRVGLLKDYLRYVVLPVLGICGGTIAGAQTTWHVDGSCGDDAWSGLSVVCQAPDGPKRTIQAGMDVAQTGDTVLVIGRAGMEEQLKKLFAAE